MAEWLYEEGIGESRAALVEDGRIVEAWIELPGLRCGTVAAGRLTAILVPGRRGIVTLTSGEEVLLEPLPSKLTEGAAVRIEIVREALSEPGRAKLAKSRVTDEAERAGPTLPERIAAAKAISAVGPDPLEEAGWS